MNCAFCQSPMKDYESNNPKPFVFYGGEGRVCRGCDDFVSATRFFARTQEQVEYIQALLEMSFHLRQARKESMKHFEELKKQQEE
jgi:hypothetical protein